MQTVSITVIKDFFIYSFGSFFLRIVSMIIVPLNMRMLTPADYGTLSLITAFITITTAIIGLGLRQVLSLEYFHHDAAQKKKIVNELITIYTLGAIPLVAIVFLMRSFIIHTVFLDAISPFTFIATLVIIGLFFYVELMYQILQYERMAIPLTIIQIVIALIISGNTVLFVWPLQWGFAGIINAQLIGACVGFSIAIMLYKNHCYHDHFSRDHALTKTRYYLIAGLPFIPGIISNWMLSSADRWVLAYYGSLNDVGIYAIADLFAQLFYTLILMPWAGSYIPYIMNRYRENKNNLAAIEKENKRIMIMSMATATGLIALAYLTMQPVLRFILPSNYHPALPYIWILLMGQVFLLGTYFASCLIQFHKHRIFLALSLAAPAILNVVLNVMLVPGWGITGCALATLISYVFYFTITLAYNKKILKGILV